MSGCKISTTDRKSTRLNSSHLGISYAVCCLKKKRDAGPIPPGRAEGPTFALQSRRHGDHRVLPSLAESGWPASREVAAPASRRVFFLTNRPPAKFNPFPYPAALR